MEEDLQPETGKPGRKKDLWGCSQWSQQVEESFNKSDCVYSDLYINLEVFSSSMVIIEISLDLRAVHFALCPRLGYHLVELVFVICLFACGNWLSTFILLIKSINKEVDSSRVIFIVSTSDKVGLVTPFRLWQGVDIKNAEDRDRKHGS
ncbi:hypothetical protein RHMOL_Rhmol01G0002200 [Rhododendron molle]|uniref:Uncharacterized protein n=1 Tax=Rhododendron molle TaxID=49168 RepID=A0ACC0PZS5_RHOML|nr:hypothetical protein RHMOL_Rhmol01G0002200 [Rhododendron molle]